MVLFQEAENLLALQNAPTPLKGGVNTPLHDLNLQSALPQDRSVVTPNTVLSNIGATPSSVVQGITFLSLLCFFLMFIFITVFVNQTLGTRYLNCSHLLNDVLQEHHGNLNLGHHLVHHSGIN